MFLSVPFKIYIWKLRSSQSDGNSVSHTKSWTAWTAWTEWTNWLDPENRVRLCVDEPFFNVSFAGFTSDSVRDLPQKIAARTSKNKKYIEKQDLTHFEKQVQESYYGLDPSKSSTPWI